MTADTIRELISNTALLLSISILYNIFFLAYDTMKKRLNIILGIIIGCLGILLMMNTVSLSDGIIFDTRSILISVTGLFFGFVPTIIAAAIICIYRIFLGGAGALAGVMVTLLSAGIGLIWNKYRLNDIIQKKKHVWIELYIFGFIVHVGMLACMLAMPKDQIILILDAISFPVLSIYPIGSLMLSLVMLQGLKNKETELKLKKSELRFRTLFEKSPIGMAISNKNSIIFINDMLENILGRQKEEIISIGWKNLTHPDDLEKDEMLFNRLNSGEIKNYSIQKRYIRKDNSIIWVNMIIASVSVDNQSSVEHICMLQDITDIKHVEATLRKSEENYKSLFYEYQKKESLLISLLDSIPDLVFYKDENSVYLGCNKAFEIFADKNKEELIGLTDFDMFDTQMAALFRKMDKAMMDEKKQRRNEEIVTYPDGKEVYLETLKTPFYDTEGKILGLIGVSRDITERKKTEAEIVYLNYHDVLTGLHNRAYYEKERSRLDAPSQLPLSVIIGDINGLKLINDAFGHAEGDKLLITIGKILKSCSRDEDVLVRTGGDEFIIMLPKTDYQTTGFMVQQILKACEAEYEFDSEFIYSSISLGYATKMNKNEPFEKIFKLAEESMYRKKLLEYKSFHSSIMYSIKTTLFEKSNETQEHAERMADLSKKLGNALELDDEDLIALELVATLHDIGKISIDQNILTKTGRLTDEEWTEIRKHPEVGYRIAQTIPELRNVSEYILCHHERWDGKGYPQGLSGRDIPLLSRILAIVDAYDAMTEDRSYRKAMSTDLAVAELLKNAGTQFDPIIVKIFIEYVLDN